MTSSHHDDYTTNGFDRDGYNASGFDAYGYDRTGFGPDGYDATGYDRDGFDRDGYDRNGRDRYGFDRLGRDSAGRDASGFYPDGYNDAGFDPDGYDRAGFNRYGYDRTVHDRNGRKAATDPAPAAPATRDAVQGLIGGTAVTLAVTMVFTGLVAWIVHAGAARLDSSGGWTALHLDLPVVPAPITAAMTAVAFAVLAVMVMVAATIFLPGPLLWFRLLVALVAVAVILKASANDGLATWITNSLIIATAAAAIAILTPLIRPRHRPQHP